MAGADFLRKFIGRGALDERDAFAGVRRFAFTGLATTLIYALIAYALHTLGLSARVSSVLSLVTCWVISYEAQRRVTFRKRTAKRGEFVRFLIMSVVGLGVSEVAMGVLYGRLGAPFWAAVLFVCLVIPTINFLSMNFWIFHRTGIGR